MISLYPASTSFFVFGDNITVHLLSPARSFSVLKTFRCILQCDCIFFNISGFSVAKSLVGYLLRVTVCSTFPFLSIMRSSSVFLLADTMEKPGSGLQNTVPSMGFTLRASEPAELVI